MPMRTASSPTTGDARLRRKLLLAAGLALAASTAAADEPRLADRRLDFSLYLNRARTDLDYPGDRVSTRIDRIGIHWREQYQPLWLGLMGGWSYVTQTQHPATAGLELGGYHVGFTFELELYAAQPLRVALEGGYLYERVDEGTDGNDVELDWHIPWVQVLAKWRPVPVWELYGGVRYDYIEGEQRLRGAVNSTTDIDHRAETGGVVGIKLNVDGDGYVALEGNDGATHSVALHFGRRY